MAREMKEASKISEGNIILIDEEPCKVRKVSSSMPGKHGHAKYSIEAVGLFDGKKRQIRESSESKIEIPNVDINDGQVISISGDSIQLMDLDSYETFEMAIPEELEGEVEEGDEIKYIKSMGKRKIRTD
ncbi:MAG: translation initiation factor IF-5A [Candidatus Hadarchaeia archaeon]